MIVLGLSGGCATEMQREWDVVGEAWAHDGAAVLIADGKVIAGVEEERLNRIKHSWLFPAEASRWCLLHAGIAIGEVDAIAFARAETDLDGWLGAAGSARELLGKRLHGLFGGDVRGKLHFVDRLQAHADSAFPYAGGDDALVLVLDGAGEFASGMVGRAQNGSFQILGELAHSQSLGAFYGNVIRFLGLGRFDEYKAMGLAPYGDPAVYREPLCSLVALMDHGQFRLAAKEEVDRVLARQVPLSHGSDDLLQCHRDLAAAVQACLETVVLHLLKHWQNATGLRHLCLAGSVAHNCAMNGKILASGWFESVFVQPAAHHAGSALGAANHVSRRLRPELSIAPLRHVYWGPQIAHGETLRVSLHAWRAWLDLRRSDDIVADTAACLAAGEVVGWVQGASEFGPRALGNRSILADPRPAGNRARINRMIKKREEYRPFAPAVTEEAAGDYFELGGTSSLPYMSVVVPVREAHRRSLGAVTHVDGSARVQTVCEQDNPRFWALLNAFGAQTGVPMLLNTSFNNNVEPIVDSVDDAICCFLTTGLDKLVVGDYLLTHRAGSFAEKFQSAALRLAWHAVLPAVAAAGACVASALTKEQTPVGLNTLAFLRRLSNSAPQGFLEILAQGIVDDESFYADILALWEMRLICIAPLRQGEGEPV
ncbi:MAG: carbamoyltransferase C-terminal domain-containing protein [Burkholderiaceae bacterium]|nr:carbamoyltransferase C-terminal domain-containing protein [Burkholderiaceae bacterium]